MKKFFRELFYSVVGEQAAIWVVGTIGVVLLFLFDFTVNEQRYLLPYWQQIQFALRLFFLGIILYILYWAYRILYWICRRIWIKIKSRGKAAPISSVPKTSHVFWGFVGMAILAWALASVSDPGSLFHVQSDPKPKLLVAVFHEDENPSKELFKQALGTKLEEGVGGEIEVQVMDITMWPLTERFSTVQDNLPNAQEMLGADLSILISVNHDQPEGDFEQVVTIKSYSAEAPISVPFDKDESGNEDNEQRKKTYYECLGNDFLKISSYKNRSIEETAEETAAVLNYITALHLFAHGDQDDGEISYDLLDILQDSETEKAQTIINTLDFHYFKLVPSIIAGNDIDDPEDRQGLLKAQGQLTNDSASQCHAIRIMFEATKLFIQGHTEKGQKKLQESEVGTKPFIRVLPQLYATYGITDTGVISQGINNLGQEKWVGIFFASIADMAFVDGMKESQLGQEQKSLSSLYDALLLYFNARWSSKWTEDAGEGENALNYQLDKRIMYLCDVLSRNYDDLKTYQEQNSEMLRPLLVNKDDLETCVDDWRQTLRRAGQLPPYAFLVDYLTLPHSRQIVRTGDLTGAIPLQFVVMPGSDSPAPTGVHLDLDANRGLFDCRLGDDLVELQHKDDYRLYVYNLPAPTPTKGYDHVCAVIPGADNARGFGTPAANVQLTWAIEGPNLYLQRKLNVALCLPMDIQDIQILLPTEYFATTVETRPTFSVEPNENAGQHEDFGVHISCGGRGLKEPPSDSTIEFEFERSKCEPDTQGAWLYETQVADRFDHETFEFRQVEPILRTSASGPPFYRYRLLACPRPDGKTTETCRPNKDQDLVGDPTAEVVSLLDENSEPRDVFFPDGPGSCQ